MKKERQLPLSFNTDKQIRSFRDSLKKIPDKDLTFLVNSADHEFTRRARPMFRTPDTKEALAGFLDKVSFDYFCTFTTRKPVSLYATRRIAEKVCERVEAPQKSSVFWAAEEFDVRDGFHFHALMKMDQPRPVITVDGTSRIFQPFNKMELFDWYFQKYGRCQIIDNREPDRQLAASHYISKYITKRITDYDFQISRYHLR